jgi:hypothetical protein
MAACAIMALPQVAVILLLLSWSRPIEASIVIALLGGQILMMQRLLRDPMGLPGLILVAAFVAMALFAPWLAPYDPLKIDVANKLKPPSPAHWAGTDQLGRDTL